MDNLSSISQGFDSAGSIIGSVAGMASGGRSIGQGFSDIYSAANDFARAKLEEQSLMFEGEMAKIGADLNATQMDLEASQTRENAKSRRAIAKFEEARWIEHAGRIAVGALFEEHGRRKDLEATLANQNAISAANGGAGMSTVAFMSNTIDVTNRDIMMMKWTASTEASVAIRNGRLARLDGNLEASRMDQDASNKNLEAQFVRFGGVMKRTASTLKGNIAGLRRGAPSSFGRTFDSLFPRKPAAGSSGSMAGYNDLSGSSNTVPDGPF